jgi:hypothetical protein
MVLSNCLGLVASAGSANASRIRSSSHSGGGRKRAANCGNPMRSACRTTSALHSSEPFILSLHSRSSEFGHYRSHGHLAWESVTLQSCHVTSTGRCWAVRGGQRHRTPKAGARARRPRTSRRILDCAGSLPGRRMGGGWCAAATAISSGTNRLRIDARLTQSGVALRWPPHSKTRPYQPSAVKLRGASGLRRVHRRCSWNAAGSQTSRRRWRTATLHREAS